ncbi:MAG: KEOPS complex subunit Cgi121 [Candidatus ainarchaeum sp.]|nr:KEOPS complex subunit Cgi121 [Candidatus ainarchaeum sp.]
MRLRSGLDTKTLFSRLGKADAVMMRTGTIGSIGEAALALHLAQRAFANKKNIARQLKYEFLLWISGKTDIASAMKATAPQDKKEFFVILFTEREHENLLKSLDVEELPLGLKQEADPLALEKISLSRI